MCYWLTKNRVTVKLITTFPEQRYLAYVALRPVHRTDNRCKHKVEVRPIREGEEGDWTSVTGEDMVNPSALAIGETMSHAIYATARAVRASMTTTDDT